MTPEEKFEYLTGMKPNFIPPDESQCAHCRQQFNPVLKLRKESLVAIRTLFGDGDPDVVYFLCAVCTMELGEFMEPELLENKEWHDQKEALIRIIKAAQN